MSKFMPVFTGGTFGSNEIVVAQENFIFESEEELKQANEERPFIDFFPFAVIFSRVHEVDGGFEGVEVNIGDTQLYCISGEWFNDVD